METKRNKRKKKDFGILTNEISKATFGIGIKEHKDFKNILEKSKANLRDHMDDWELILTMIEEKVTTDITKKEDSQGFDEYKHVAKEGGEIAGNTRKQIEEKIGKSLVSKENYLHLTKKKKVLKVE